MVLSREEKSEIMKKYQAQPGDSGSPEVQIALMTERINYLTEHLKTHTHDYHTRVGLMKLVGKRKRLLNYLKKEESLRYEKLIKKLNIRG